MTQDSFSSASTRSPRPRVVIADDHRVVAEGLERLLLDHVEVVCTVSTGEALVECVHSVAPDLVISDINMPGLNGLSVIRQLRRQGIDVPFIFLTMHREPSMVSEAIHAGASAYVLKSSAGEELLLAIQAVIQGRTYITPTLGAQVIGARAVDSQALTGKQLEVLRYVVAGLRSKQIAFELGISVRTVESHKYAIMQILGVHSAVELVRKSREFGLVDF